MGDKRGGRGKKSQKMVDVIYGPPISIALPIGTWSSLVSLSKPPGSLTAFKHEYEQPL